MKTTVIDLLEKRSPYRAIDPRPVEKEKVRALVEAARLSASCMNNQPWRFLVLDDPEALDRGRPALAEGNAWARTAPVLIIGFSRKDLDCCSADGRLYYLFDLGMAAQNILLQATELDLVARPMAGFRPDLVRRAFSIPAEDEIVLMIAVGYRGDLGTLREKHRQVSTAVRVRNPVQANFHFNAYQAGDGEGAA